MEKKLWAWLAYPHGGLLGFSYMFDMLHADSLINCIIILEWYWLCLLALVIWIRDDRNDYLVFSEEKWETFAKCPDLKSGLAAAVSDWKTLEGSCGSISIFRWTLGAHRPEDYKACNEYMAWVYSWRGSLMYDVLFIWFYLFNIFAICGMEKGCVGEMG